MDPREWLFDKRVVRRNLDKGVLTTKAYKEYLKGLPALDGEIEELEIEARLRAGELADGRGESSGNAG
jgi:hypothetical protein